VVRRAGLAVGLVVVLLVGVGGGWWLIGRHHRAGARSVATPSVVVSGDAQAREVAAALGRLATDPTSLVAYMSQKRVAGRAQLGVPARSTVTVDERSWLPDGAGGGIILVTVTSPGMPAVTYAAVMIHEPNGWKVAETVPVARTMAPTPTSSP
jgi:hypothetical protein